MANISTIAKKLSLSSTKLPSSQNRSGRHGHPSGLADCFRPRRPDRSPPPTFKPKSGSFRPSTHFSPSLSSSSTPKFSSSSSSTVIFIPKSRMDPYRDFTSKEEVEAVDPEPQGKDIYQHRPGAHLQLNPVVSYPSLPEELTSTHNVADLLHNPKTPLENPMRILILGGGMGAIGCVHFLMKHVLPSLPKYDPMIGRRSHYQVCILSPQKHYFWRNACARMIADPDFLREPQEPFFVPFEEYLRRRYPVEMHESVQALRFAHGRAIQIRRGDQVIKASRMAPPDMGKWPGDGRDGEQMIDAEVAATTHYEISYDALILAYGVRKTFELLNAPGPDETIERRLERYRNFSQRIKNGKMVVIAGAGAVGVELAGEIAEAVNRNRQPSGILHHAASLFSGRKNEAKVQVLLVDPKARLLDQLGDEEMSRLAGEHLEKVGVTVMLNRRVANVFTVPSSDGGDKDVVHLDDGTVLDSDVFIDCTTSTACTDCTPPEWMVCPEHPLFAVRPYSVLTNPESMRLDTTVVDEPPVYAVGDAVVWSRGGGVATDNTVVAAMSHLGAELVELAVERRWPFLQISERTGGAVGAQVVAGGNEKRSLEEEGGQDDPNNSAPAPKTKIQTLTMPQTQLPTALPAINTWAGYLDPGPDGKLWPRPIIPHVLVSFDRDARWSRNTCLVPVVRSDAIPDDLTEGMSILYRQQVAYEQREAYSWVKHERRAFREWMEELTELEDRALMRRERDSERARLAREAGFGRDEEEAEEVRRPIYEEEEEEPTEEDEGEREEEEVREQEQEQEHWQAHQQAHQQPLQERVVWFHDEVHGQESGRKPSRAPARFHYQPEQPIRPQPERRISEQIAPDRQPSEPDERKDSVLDGGDHGGRNGAVTSASSAARPRPSFSFALGRRRSSFLQGQKTATWMTSMIRRVSRSTGSGGRSGRSRSESVRTPTVATDDQQQLGRSAATATTENATIAAAATPVPDRRRGTRPSFHRRTKSVGAITNTNICVRTGPVATARANASARRTIIYTDSDHDDEENEDYYYHPDNPLSLRASIARTLTRRLIRTSDRKMLEVTEDIAAGKWKYGWARRGPKDDWGRARGRAGAGAGAGGRRAGEDAGGRAEREHGWVEDKNLALVDVTPPVGTFYFECL